MKLNRRLLRLPLFASLILLFNSCGGSGEPSVESPEVPEINTPKEPSRQGAFPITVKATLDQLRIRKQAGIDFDVIGSLPLGTEVPYGGEMTSSTTRIKLRGVWHDEPWISIKTPEGDTGWVYGGGVVFLGEDSEELAEMLLGNRMKSILGEKLTEEVISYQEAYANAPTSQAFENVFLKGDSLKSKIIKMMDEKVHYAASNDLPDMYWLETVMPGYVVELVAEGTEYYLFKDYGQMNKKARQTEGQEDDMFTDLGMEVFNNDGIEYWFASYFVQTWDFGGHSLLGSGKHNDIFALVDEIFEMTDLFKDEVVKFKEDAMKDITNPENTYWNSQASILKELNDILEADYPTFSKKDKVAIETRIKQFEAAKENGISVNLRVGE